MSHKSCQLYLKWKLYPKALFSQMKKKHRLKEKTIFSLHTVTDNDKSNSNCSKISKSKFSKRKAQKFLV